MLDCGCKTTCLKEMVFMPTIKQIAEKINTQSKNFEIGKLQEIRKKIKNLGRIPGKKIFDNKSIKDGYAFIMVEGKSFNIT